MAKVLSVLDELDRTQKLLEAEFPGCRIAYIYSPDRITWTARIGPALQADDPDSLREAIAGTLAKIRNT